MAGPFQTKRATGAPGGGQRLRSLAVLAVATLIVHGCSDASDGGAGDAAAIPVDTTRGGELARSDGNADQRSYRAGPVTEPGQIRGTVRYEGELPAPKRFSVPPEDRIVCGPSVEVRSVERGARNGLRGAIVSLRGVDHGRPFSSEAPVLDQRRCRFEPHVVTVPVGGDLEVRNSDPLTHNVHTLTFENRPVNRSQPSGMDLSLSFEEPEHLRVGCDIHPWMEAIVVVSDHPYHAVTGDDGEFVLRGVAPGSYSLVAWHPELGSVQGEVMVGPGETSGVTLVFSR